MRKVIEILIDYILKIYNLKDKSVDELANQIFKEKEEHRKKMANLPIEEKMRILVKLQKIAVSVHPELKRKGIPWQL